jgi:hypothetical protein
VKIFLDGDTQFPTLVGTGSEDYIGTGWGQGEFLMITPAVYWPIKIPWDGHTTGIMYPIQSILKTIVK